MAQTKEERKAAKKASDAKYCTNNADKIKIKKAKYHIENSEKIKEYKAIYRVANAEKIKVDRDKYRHDKENADKLKKYQATYRAANSDKAKAYQAEYYAANANKIKVSITQYKKENPEVRRRARHKRRALKAKCGGTLSKGLTERLMTLQRGKCACCKKSVKDGHHLDHIMPLILGGSNTDDNIQLLCPSCNCSKGAKHPTDFMQSRGFLL